MIRALIAISILTLPLAAFAQEAKPDLSAFSPETRKSYEDTQKFIDQTQSKISLVRTQTDARAKEIEALANRVGDIITKMSGQGEDNTALQSEISVHNELLALERKSTVDLRSENTKLSSAVETYKLENVALQKQHADLLKSKQAELAKTQLLLNVAVENAKSREKTNNVLVTNIQELTKETERLEKQVKILKENRYRSKRRTSTNK